MIRYVLIFTIKIGLDPAGVSYFLKPERYIQSGLAIYVQIIHTDYFDNWKDKSGTGRMTGDVDILVRGINRTMEHEFAIYMLMATATRAAVLTAHRVPSDDHGSESYPPRNAITSDVSLGRREVLVGYFSERDDNKQGVFRLNLEGLGLPLYNSIHHLFETRNRGQNP